MKKIVLIFAVAATMFASCASINKAEMAKVHNMALVSAGAQKLFYHGSQSLSGQIIASATNGDTLSFSPYVEQFKGKCFSEVFVSAPVKLMAEDSVINDSNYLLLNSRLKRFSVLESTPAKGYKMLNDMDVSNIKKMALLYPSADAFMFVHANYKVKKVASISTGSSGVLGSIDMGGLARVTASYVVSIYNREGKRIMFYQTRAHWSKSIFPFALSLGFNERSRQALTEADEYAYNDFKKHVQRQLMKLETKTK